MTDMIVSGAGYSDCNGTYVEKGTTNGKPWYELATYNIITWAAPYWNIIAGGVIYRSTDDVATPDLCTTWTTGKPPYPPVPTVTAASSGTTHEGEAVFSSLSYLRTKKRRSW